MIIFNNKKYKLFFSNALPPLIALNYADEQFFKEFKKLCGTKYRIVSIIKKGWQKKYGLLLDIEKLSKNFASKINNKKWAPNLLTTYNNQSKELKKILTLISSKNYSNLNNSKIIKALKKVRHRSAPLDALSNMLHLFSSLVGNQFFESLCTYTDDKNKINKNFIFYTQPIKESRFAKIKIKTLANKIKLSDKDKNFSKILRIGTFIKDDVSELLDLRKELMENLFKEVSKRIDCSVEDLEYLQINEIEKSLLEKKSSSQLIKKRRDITILYYPKNALKIYEGDKAKAFLKKAKLREVIKDKKIKTLKGQIASLGKATGKIIIANNSDQALKKIKPGNILVAPYTAIEYVPAMKKAAAIITETGGITSPSKSTTLQSLIS